MVCWGPRSVCEFHNQMVWWDLRSKLSMKQRRFPHNNTRKLQCHNITVPQSLNTTSTTVCESRVRKMGVQKGAES